ncbi:acyl-CoA dehydrogenase family protein [Nocardiopsis sediminis]|uniref:Acyl-CoA dehydrogenase family protein n=1 Tax=Nocardiopsis sediminis TaxID=1778267 RepID=A0ABV8FG61_9ACTN
MDFALDPTQEELRRLATDVFDGETTPERLRPYDPGARSAPAPGHDTGIWAAVARSGLIGAALAEDAGGTGGGAVEAAIVLREAAARGAPVPALATLALGALPVSLCGTAAQRAALAPVAAGRRILTAGVAEPGRHDPADPATTAVRDGAGLVVTGTKVSVPHAADADTILVPARLDGGGTGVLLVPRDTAGLTLTPEPTGAAITAAHVGLDGARVPAEALLGGDTTGAAARTLRRCTLAGLAATVSGALAAALALTTEHVRTRRQFGRSLAELQAVTMKVGDIYVAARALDAAMWAGAWRIDAPPASGEHDTDAVLAAAALLITDQAHDAFYTAQHLHGGLGVDASYPLHRHFSTAAWAARLLGGTEARLDALGDLAVRDTPVHAHA